MARWTALVAPLGGASAARLGAGAAAVRLVWVLATARPPGGLSDPLLYQRFADGIARGHGYVSWYGRPTAYYPPGYPFFLGAIQWVLRGVGAEGSLHWGAGVLQALLGGLAAVAVAVAGARWFGRGVGLAAGAVLAAWPNVVAYSSTLLSESLYVPLFAVALAALATATATEREARAPLARGPGHGSGIQPDATTSEDLPSHRRAVLVAAAALGSAALVRPQVLVAVPALVVADLVAARRRVAARTAIALVAGAVLVVAPWTVRNLLVMDDLIAVSTNGGDNLCVGFHQGAPGHFVVPPACDTGEFYTDGPAAEVRRNEETAARARRWALHHLGTVPGLSLRKLWYTYEADTDGLRAVEAYEQNRFLPSGVRTGLRVLCNAAYAAVLAAWAGGVAILVAPLVRDRRSVTGWVAARALALCISAMAVPVLVFGDGRFKVPAAPAIAIVAGVALDVLARRVVARRATSQRAG